MRTASQKTCHIPEKESLAGNGNTTQWSSIPTSKIIRSLYDKTSATNVLGYYWEEHLLANIQTFDTEMHQ